MGLEPHFLSSPLPPQSPGQAGNDLWLNVGFVCCLWCWLIILETESFTGY